MAVFTRTKTWVSNEVLTASDLNAEFNNLLNNTIPASIEDYSADVATMQSTTDPGGVGTESLATTLAGELTRIRFAIKRIVGGAQWYTAPVIDLGSTISAADIASDAVTTAKILDANVTKAKLAAVGQQISSSCGTFSTSSASYVDITNLTVTITTTGRPVYIGLMCTQGQVGYLIIQNTSSGSAARADIGFLRDSTDIFQAPVYIAAAGATQITSLVTLAGYSTVDPVAAGTYTYKAQAKLVSGTGFNAVQAKLIAYEF